MNSGPHLAERALKEGRAIPAEAGFMGLVTLQDVLESVLQERIYDEEDIAQRNLASAVLTQWAANKLQKFMKRQQMRRTSSFIAMQKTASSGSLSQAVDSSKVVSDEVVNDRTPLLPKKIECQNIRIK